MLRKLGDQNNRSLLPPKREKKISREMNSSEKPQMLYDQLCHRCYVYLTMFYWYESHTKIFLWALWYTHPGNLTKQNKEKHYIILFYFYFLKILFIFRKRGMVGEGEGGKHQCVVASHVAPTWDLAHNPGMCSDWESNQWLLGSQASTQSTEPYQSRPLCICFKYWRLIKVFKVFSLCEIFYFLVPLLFLLFHSICTINILML